jgi:transporter family-2 protein
MTARATDYLLGLAGGLFIALMLHSNGLVARHTTPTVASWVAHGVGAAVALLLVALAAAASGRAGEPRLAQGPRPAWVYLGGVPGALTVVLAAITVNGALALSGTVALMLLGQALFGLLCDSFGLFGAPTRRVGRADLLVALCILTGSALILFGRPER